MNIEFVCKLHEKCLIVKIFNTLLETIMTNN